MSPVVEGPSVDDLIAFLRDYYKQSVLELAQKYPSEQTSLEVTHSDLRTAFPQFADGYTDVDGHEEVTERLTEALQQYDLPIDVSLDDAHVRIVELPSTEVHDVGVPMVSEIEERVQGLRGQVSKLSKKQQLMTKAVFECQRCGTQTTIPQYSDGLDEPHECQGCERQGPFRLNKSASKKPDHQLIRLQTPPEASDDGSTDDIDVDIFGDLVGSVAPGDRIIANSRVELEQQSEGSRVFVPVARAQSIDRIDSDFDDIDVSEHLDRIREIAESGMPVQHVVDSIVPSHEGDEEIKESIALQLFGGVDKELPDGSKKRGTIHVALIGDPGCGKSALLRYAKHLAPRSVFATGKGSSAAGLTAAAVQDDFGNGGWTLESGALVEANGGLCAIDELDDMAVDDQAGLLEALSDQEVSINKAGINAELPADTTVLAAANPIHGRFDEYESIAEQFDFDPALISRFDLIFTMKDRPDEEKDEKIVDTILDSAEAGQRIARGEEVEDPTTTPTIEPEVLRAYIAHAREITPVVNEDTKQMIKDQYLNLRQANDNDGPIPVTPRAPEALIRLSEASARIRLSETITEEDAARAARIHQSCMEDVGIDPETGEFDVDMIETGSSTSQKDRMRNVKGLITELNDQYENGAPYDELVELAEQADLSKDKLDHALEKLSNERQVYEPSAGKYRLL